MRIFACSSFVFSLTGLILSLLTLFAGSRKGFMEHTEIMTINLSQLGRELIKNGTTDSNGSAGSTATSLASQVGLHDWYSMHVMDYCEGSYSSSYSRSIESCSNAVPFFSFNPIQIIDSQFKGDWNMSVFGVKAGLDLSASGWPSEINNVASKAVSAYKIMFFMMCLGIAASGVETIVSLVIVVIDGRTMSHGTTISLINLGLAGASLLGQAISSAIITLTMRGMVNIINSQGAKIGLTATQGNKYLWISWAAAILMLLATLVWISDFCVERRLDSGTGYERYEELPYESPAKVRRRELAAMKENEKAMAKVEVAEMLAARRVERPSPGYMRPVLNGVVRHGVGHMASSIPTPGMPNFEYAVNGVGGYPGGSSNQHHFNMYNGGWNQPQQPFF